MALVKCLPSPFVCRLERVAELRKRYTVLGGMGTIFGPLIGGVLCGLKE